MVKMNTLDWIVTILVLIGALNWGLIAINAEWNLVTLLLGTWPMGIRIVYGLVGISAVYSAIKLFK